MLRPHVCVSDETAKVGDKRYKLKIVALKDGEREVLIVPVVDSEMSVVTVTWVSGGLRRISWRTAFGIDGSLWQRHVGYISV